MDFSHRPTGERGWKQLIDECSRLGDQVERHYLELKESVGLPGSTKVAAAKIARFILGAANRMPEAAASAFDGAAILLVGISKGGEVVGVERVDAADWSDSLSRYFGPAEPRWDYQWIEYGTRTIMAVIVEPPQQGDPIFRAYQSGEGITDGDVLIRTEAQTRRATAMEQARLDERARHAPPAKLSASCAARPSAVDAAEVRRNVAHWAIRRASDLPLPGNGGLGAMHEDRSPDEYMREVRAWRQLLTKEPPERVVDALAVHHPNVQTGSLGVRNLGEMDLQQVQLTIELPQHVRALVANEDSSWQIEEAAFPPRGWQQMDYRDIVPVQRIKDEHIEITGEGDHRELVWHIRHLPPLKRLTSEEKVGLWTFLDEVPSHLSWRLTAAGVHGVVRGELHFTEAAT